MATTGLFGSSPYELQQERQAQLATAADAYGRTNPNDPYGFDRARSGLYMAGSQLGGGIAGLMGVEDPQMKKAADIQSILKNFDPTTLEGLQGATKELAAKGYAQEAMAAAAKAQEIAQGRELTRKTSAEATAAEYKLSQDKLFRTEFNALGPNATVEEQMAVINKFGGIDAVGRNMQLSQDRKVAADAKVEAARVAGEAKIEAARLAGATAKELAQIRAETARDIATMRSEDKREAAATKKADAANKPLAPSLQKSEDTDLAAVDAATAQTEVLKPVIAALTPDPKTNKAALVLGPIQNLKYEADNFRNQSTPESRAYANLKRSVAAAVNLKVSAEKGVQTDKDVLRFAQELESAFGKNDTKTTLEALTNFNNAIERAATRTKERIDSRRTSQGVDAYYKKDPTEGTAANPIKLN